jgi:hypothetical protein
MPGTWTTTRVSPWAIHTFTAPEDGWLVNSHIIELPSQLFVIDGQYTILYRPASRVLLGAMSRKPAINLIGERHALVESLSSRW